VSSDRPSSSLTQAIRPLLVTPDGEGTREILGNGGWWWGAEGMAPMRAPCRYGQNGRDPYWDVTCDLISLVRFIDILSDISHVLQSGTRRKVILSSLYGVNDRITRIIFRHSGDLQRYYNIDSKR
jgi:hypothetical protein